MSALFTVAVYSFLAYKIYQGRSWARWVFAVLWILGMLGLSVLSFAPQVARQIPWTAWVMTGIQTVIQLTALVLLFVPVSSRWFRATS